MKRAKSGKRTNGDTDEPPKPKPKCRMPEGDADNFLNLSAAMKILLARTITKSELPRARELLTDYWWRFLKVSPGLLIYFAHPDRSYLLPVSPRYSEAQPSLSGPYF